jgi:diguanylate cyclase (GGDEF)-like protein/PAS domain S-box-containing protein
VTADGVQPGSPDERTVAAAAEHAPFGYLATTSAGVVRAANAAVLALLGHPDDGAVVGRPFAELLKPGARVVWLTHHVPRLEQGGRLDAVAVDLVRRDGSVLPVLLTATLVPSEGRPGVRITVVDAAERRAYEQDLLLARLAAERAEWRMRALQQVTEVCAGALEEPDLLAGVAAAVTTCLEVGRTRVWLSPGDGAPLVPVGGPDELSRSTPAAAPTGVSAAWARGELVVPASVGAGSSGSAAVPFGHGGTLLGVLEVDLPGTWRGAPSDLAVLGVMATVLGEALARVRLHARLERLALFDALTGLPNRTLVLDRLERAVLHADRTGRPVAVLFADLDGFKAINDQHGHAVGDRVLQAAAGRLEAAVRAGDTVGRLGGDEFVVVCEDADEGTADEIVARLQAALARDLHWDVPGLPEGLRVGTSVGVAIGRRPFADDAPSALLQAGDAAMYDAKRARREASGRRTHGASEL